MENQNKIFRAHKNISINFKKYIGLALENKEHIQENLEIF